MDDLTERINLSIGLHTPSCHSLSNCINISRQNPYSHAFQSTIAPINSPSLEIHGPIIAKIGRCSSDFTPPAGKIAISPLCSTTRLPVKSKWRENLDNGGGGVYTTRKRGKLSAHVTRTKFVRNRGVAETELGPPPDVR